MHLLVTGGCGFIGCNFIRYMLKAYPKMSVTNFDKLTYAGNPENLRDFEKSDQYSFIQGDICEPATVEKVFRQNHFDAIVHFAAESHVDRSIDGGSVFVNTNVLGTYTLLEAAKQYNLQKFIHISTDEVYGSTLEGSFTEKDVLKPSSPYSASKAGSDLLAISFYTTHRLPVIVTRCTNNYGPYQYPEKLIPFFTTNCIEGKKLPIYGTGENVRDWLYVIDHCRAIDFILRNGTVGEIYNIGGGEEKTNLEITTTILNALGKDESMIEYVEDRKGHDFRYSLDSSKLKQMGWEPRYSFEEAMSETIQWYVENEWWWCPLKNGNN